MNAHSFMRKQIDQFPDYLIRVMRDYNIMTSVDKTIEFRYFDELNLLIHSEITKDPELHITCV